MLVTIRFYEELNDFLPGGRRKKDFTICFQGRRTIKDFIESLGVPHVEIDLLLVNGEPVNFEYIIQGGDRISAYPMFEAFDISEFSLIPRAPLRRPRFVADANVMRLGKIMRLMGFDCLQNAEWSDARISHISAEDRRIVLTRDRDLLKRRNIQHGLYVRHIQPVHQAQEVVRRLQLRNQCRPFSRCLSCNWKLLPVDKNLVMKNPGIPQGVKDQMEQFEQCQGCGKIYWQGSHFKRMERTLDHILSSLQHEETQ
jgi:hypothetical protein